MKISMFYLCLIYQLFQNPPTEPPVEISFKNHCLTVWLQTTYQEATLLRPTRQAAYRGKKQMLHHQLSMSFSFKCKHY